MRSIAKISGKKDASYQCDWGLSDEIAEKIRDLSRERKKISQPVAVELHFQRGIRKGKISNQCRDESTERRT